MTGDRRCARLSFVNLRTVYRGLSGSVRRRDWFSFQSTMFDPQPTLTGQLLELRPLRPNDWPALFAVASDPLIWEQHPESDRYKDEVFRQFFADALTSGGALVAIDRATGQIIGSSRYHGFDATEGVVEIGWTFLARRYWGGRYNGEMKRLMLAHAFKTVDQVI